MKHMRIKNCIYYFAIVVILLHSIGCCQNLQIDGDGYGRTTLANGITVLVNIDKNTSLTGARILIGGGLLTETAANNGISNLMTRLLLKGNDSMTAEEISSRLDFLGAQVTPGSFRDYNAFSFVCLSENFPEVMKIISRCLLLPLFSEKELERLKFEMTGRIKAENDNQALASNKLLWKTIYGESGYGLSLLGNIDSFQNIDIVAIREHYKHLINGGNIIIGISSDLSPNKILTLLKKNLKAIPSGTTPLSPPNITPQLNKEGFVSYDRNQSFISMGFPLNHLTSNE
ncbi:MAG: insulinase family protein, partial [candidate division Zixibacteria bacterium]|nr:insulinase family protein [candidate division Zixibacteria bacterium]